MAESAPSQPGRWPGCAGEPGTRSPNASRITAIVRNVVALPAKNAATIPSPTDQTVSSFTIEIETSAGESADKKSFAHPGQVIEVLSQDALPPDLVGHRIEGSLKLTGDTRGVRWWISDVHKLP